MCKFCKFEENGDYADDYEVIVDSEPFDLLFPTEIKVDSFCTNIDFKKRLRIESGIDSDGFFYVYLFNPYAETDNEAIDRNFKRKVNYCPMCGRKLSGGNET